LALGANPNLATKKSTYGKSTFPLHLAALNGKAAATALLIASGADVNFKDTKYKTASYYATYAGHHTVAEIIETPRSLVEACDDEGNFPIHLVAENGTMQDMCKLVASRASHTITNQKGQNALHIIASCREGDSESIEMMKLLLAKCPDNASLKAYLETKDHQGDTALHVAAFYGPQYLSLLISAGANANAENNIGETPLHIATAGPCQSLSEEDDLSRISYLIKAGANINARNANGDTPLHIVNSDGGDEKHGIEVSKLLLAAGANINAQNKDGNTLLHTEAYRGNSEQVAFLITNNASLNIQNNDDQTPLHIAVIEVSSDLISSDVVSALLQAGADTSIVDNNGKTALQLAEEDVEIKELFKNGGHVVRDGSCDAAQLQTDATPVNEGVLPLGDSDSSID
jgi:ankyrin repeat protein